MATLQEIQGERHKWEVDPTRSTRAPEGTRYRLKEKYKKEQRKKSKEAPKRASMKERLSAATATKKVSGTPTKGYGPSRTGKTKIKSTDFVPFQQRTRAAKALTGHKDPPTSKSIPRTLLPALPNEAPESERQRILPELTDPMAMSKTGGKVAKSKGGTVKKKHGGTLHKKKNKKTYDNHHGGKLVASLYD